jgi:hypothetical protein
MSMLNQFRKWIASFRMPSRRYLIRNARQRSGPLQRQRLLLEQLESREMLSASAVWTAIGPAPIVADAHYAGPLALSGRVTGIATDAQDVNTIFVATAGGGVWKTSDGGTGWPL